MQKSEEGRKRMKERYYRIAGKVVKISREKDLSLGMFEKFECQESIPEVTVELWEDQRTFHRWYGVDYYQMEEDRPHLFLSRKFPRVRLTADLKWRHFVIEGAQYGEDGVMEVFLCAFYSYLSRKGGVLVHASCISWRGEGVIFTAPSGTGKTTQAELWGKYKNAEILNGDKAVLDCSETGCTLWGTPWKGSSSYAVNENVPLKAIVVLTQGSKNEIRRLEGDEAVSAFFSHVFFPSWNRLCVTGVMNSLDVLVRQVPVYFLSCLPDKEAVELTCGSVWGEGIR